VNGLLPLYPADLEEKKKLKIGEIYKAKIVNPRNYEFHKKFMALINVGHQNTKLEMPFDSYRRYVTIKAGFFNSYVTDKGTYFEAESISFANMEQDKFEEVYSRVIDVIIKDINVTQEMIEKVLASFM
jgi:hypothetical protein